MYVKFPSRDLNSGPFPSYLPNICTCRVIITIKVYSGMQMTSLAIYNVR